MSHPTGSFDERPDGRRDERDDVHRDDVRRDGAHSERLDDGHRDTRYDDDRRTEAGAGSAGEDARGRGVTLTVNQTWADQVGPQGVADYVAAVQAASRADGVVGIRDALRDAIERTGMQMPDVERERLAEQLAEQHPDEVTVVSDDGTVLLGRPDRGPALHEPPVPDEKDPDAGGRPAYS